MEGAACLLLEPGAGGELRWATAALAGGRADAAVTSVLDAVLGDAVPRVVGEVRRERTRRPAPSASPSAGAEGRRPT